MATGVLHRLAQSGFSVYASEVADPSNVRRSICFCEAVRLGTKVIEGVKGVKCMTQEDCLAAWAENTLPILVDETGELSLSLKPDIVFDAILGKKNIGNTKIDMASLVVALGPGFVVGRDCQCIIETNRGHNLGRIILEKGKSAEPNTGVPGTIQGFSTERVLRSPCHGAVKYVVNLGDAVKKGELVMYVDDTPVFAEMSGMLRGLIREGYQVTPGFKIGDIDPRVVPSNLDTISDKARTISGAALQITVMYMQNIIPGLNLHQISSD
eukprot:GCRY01001572.1.p1 GENE.GCRY01001572.1~~GCRY01001572.1.p1  ORF type:complete len:268 (-),score=21.61 GCRY01001572.1:7-810(-)